MAHIVVVAAQFVPSAAELVAVVLGGIVFGQLFAHPSRDVCHGYSAAHIPHLPEGIDSRGEAFEVIPLFLLEAQVLGQLALPLFARFFGPEAYRPLRSEMLGDEPLPVAHPL